MRLFDFLFKKQRHIESMLLEYLERWQACVDQFKRAMEVYLEQGLGDEFSFLTQQTHKLESQADDLRRGVEYEMYAKQLLPESRGDILGFLENLDRVPNRAETILFVLSSELIEFPPRFAHELRHLLTSTYEATDILLELARRVFTENSQLLAMVRRIDEKESECDFVARRLIRSIFAAPDLDGVDRLKLRDVVVQIGGLTDLVMNVADRMTIMSLKRTV